MFEFLSGFDILGVGAALAGLVLFGWLVWMLLDNKSFDSLNERHGRGGARGEDRGETTDRGRDGRPEHPNRPGRAA